ncbi:sulfatase-like hydrolase/transferase [Magnetovibrio sp.]|uniref:sulfatase-like hydrolase/transferase n=1 Tax=Magnetovibrio sp. TaxID=2024836 RepID=UPI002F94FDD1
MQNRLSRALISGPYSKALAGLRARPTLLFICVALLIPNAVFLAAIAVGIGTPQRFAAIVAYLVVGLLARNVPPPVVVGTYLTVLIYDLASTVALLFGLSFVEMFAVLKFALEVKLFASIMYVAIGLGIAFSAVAALKMLVRERAVLRRARLMPPVLAAFALIVLDVSVNSLPHYHFASAFAAGQPFESGLRSSGLEAKLDRGQGRRTVMVVMVEGLGVFEDPVRQRIVDGPLQTPAVRARYDVRSGQTAYFGSTTAAEMRELCASRSPYQSVMNGPQSACLPANLKAQGYRTVAVHGFSATMFERERWYPNIGFEQSLFARDFAASGIAQCGAVFKGACDSALVGRLQDVIETSHEPLFLYWLTLNTHIPIAPGEHSARVDCQSGGAFGDVEVCDMAGMWVDLLSGVAQLAMSEADMDILIVGDHAPPLWSRTQRAQFKPGVVPWVLLSPKGPTS